MGVCVPCHQRAEEVTAVTGAQIWQLMGREGVKMLDVLTDKLDCLVEPGADVGFVVVLDRDALVEEGVLEVVGAVGRDVDQGGDPQHVQHVFS